MKLLVENETPASQPYEESEETNEAIVSCITRTIERKVILIFPYEPVQIKKRDCSDFVLTNCALDTCSSDIWMSRQ